MSIPACAPRLLNTLPLVHKRNGKIYIASQMLVRLWRCDLPAGYVDLGRPIKGAKSKGCLGTNFYVKCMKHFVSRSYQSISLLRKSFSFKYTTCLDRM